MPKECDRIDALILLAHEVAHVANFFGVRVAGVSAGGGDHGPGFKETLNAIFRITYNVEVSIDYAASYHDLHRRLRSALLVSPWYEKTEQKAEAHSATVRPSRRMELAANQVRFTKHLAAELRYCFDSITPDGPDDPRGKLRNWFDSHLEKAGGAYVLTICPEDIAMAQVLAAELDTAASLSWEQRRTSNALGNLSMQVDTILSLWGSDG